MADDAPRRPLHIALLEPFYGGSHKRWADELKAATRHRVEIFSLPARHWKWRLRGGAVSLARQVRQSGRRFDLYLATSMLDAALFRALAPDPATPLVAYFHENQLCYPWSPRDKDAKTGRDLHYGFVNYASALAANRVFFNSRYHRQAFLDALPAFLKRFPDHQNLATVEVIRRKSRALPLGLDLRALDAHRPDPGQAETERAQAERDGPLVLWNHRWEYDKRPKEFCRALLRLADRGLPFRVAFLGERFREEPPYLAEARRRLGRRVVQFGRVESQAEYAAWLWKGHILPVASIQDFFGGSVVEAVHCGCHPLLPRRLAYPEHLDQPADEACFYDRDEELPERLVALVESETWMRPCPVAPRMARYDWSRLAPEYDHAFETAARGSSE